jgi:hypothetical protein
MQAAEVSFPSAGVGQKCAKDIRENWQKKQQHYKKWLEHIIPIAMKTKG